MNRTATIDDLSILNESYKPNDNEELLVETIQKQHIYILELESKVKALQYINDVLMGVDVKIS